MRRARRAVAALRGLTAAVPLAALTLPACVVGPEYHVPVTPAVPEQWATPAAPVSDAAPTLLWWQAFADPELERLVSAALAANPDLAAAEAEIQEARAAARVAGASLYPQLNADARLSRDKLSRNGENLALLPFRPGTTEFTDYRLGFDTSWELDLFGRTRREVEAALGRLGSATESRNDARVVLAAEVADAYLDYRLAAGRAALARRRLATLGETARLLGMQAAAGIASEEDRERAEADRLTGESVPPALEATAATALFRLEALTGLPRGTLGSELGPQRPVPVPPAMTGVGMPAALLERRPDIRRAERELAAATADIGSAVAAQFPQISLVGDVGFEAVRRGELIAAASRYWNVAPQLTVPLLAGGRLRAQVAAAEAARDAALGRYRSVVLTAIADAEGAIVRYASDARRAASLEAAAAVLRSSLARERRRAQAGDVGSLDVLLLERATDDAEDQSLAAGAGLAHDFVALGKALGGGWQLTPPAATATTAATAATAADPARAAGAATRAP